MQFVEVIKIANDNPSLMCQEFLEWLPENKHVWDAFVYEASRVRQRGFTHYSARTIIHFLRHHTNVTEVASEWKINNNHSPYMARLYDLCFPEHAGMWSYRDTPKARRDNRFFAGGAA